MHRQREALGLRGATVKMPALQFYPADWRKDLAVQALGYHDRGVWFEMLCLMHESSERGVLLLNGAPMPDDLIARLLGLDNQTFNQTVSNLLTYGVAKRREQDDAIFSKRMVSDEKLCETRRNAGKKGGNPRLLNQNPTTPVKQNSTPSSSSSSSSSDSKAAAADILSYLNEQADRNYKPVKANLSLIVARLGEATADECRAVIDAKVREWKGDPKMAAYLRPETLFGATKFAGYLGQIGDSASAGAKGYI
jgi:uncharacterized phage protein (TIGR02220 family)